MLGALLHSARHGRTDRVAILSGLMVAGILGEPNTWHTLRRPAQDPLVTACVILEIGLPLALLIESRQQGGAAMAGG
jgi:hypothetical protein